jgi:drug/metabolite transporter (DMT)-like permease
MTIGLLSAFAAAALYGAGTILQAVGVRRAAATPAGGKWAQVWAGRLYAGGLLLDGLGFLASLAALRTLPLFVVESAIASSVAITAVLAVLFLRVRLTRRELIALVAVGVGLVALAVSARAEAAVPLSGPASWLLLGCVLPVAGLGLGALRTGGSGGAAALAATAGLGFGGVGVAARVVVLPAAWWRLVLDPVAWALVAFSLIAMAAYGLALQRGSVTTVAAVTFTVETVVPAAIGLLWLGDRVRPGAAPVAVLGFVLTLGGSIVLARHAAEEVTVVSE